MAVNQALLNELMNLDGKERLEVAQLLLSTVDDGDDLDQPKNYPTGCPLVFPSKPIADSGAKTKK